MKRVDDVTLAAAAALDRDTERFERQMRYQAERDAKHGVMSLPDFEFAELLDSGTDAAGEAVSRAMYWDVLRDLPREDALVMVLRYCLGYSATEIAAGLGMTYARVKYRCRAR